MIRMNKPKSTEHTLLCCKNNRKERIRLIEKISTVGRKWSPGIILGTTGGVKEIQRDVTECVIKVIS